MTELRQRMPYAELHAWIAYVEENGPPNPCLRMEAAIARAVSPFLKNAKPRDLMPWPRERDVEATIEDAFKMIKVS